MWGVTGNHTLCARIFASPLFLSLKLTTTTFPSDGKG